MQEADVLGDSVGIMDSGIMKVKGTPLNLKTTYGSGYTLNIYTSKSSDVDHVCHLANQTIKGLEVVNTASTSTSLGIPKNQVSAIPSLARQLQERGLIQDWSVSQSTLEEVFLRLVTKKSNSAEANVSVQEDSTNACIDQGDIEEQAITHTPVRDFTCSDGSEVIIEPKSISQVRGLLRKHLILRKRSPIGAVIQFLLPIVFAAMLVLVQSNLKAPKYTKRCGSCPGNDDGYSYYGESNDDCDMIQQCENRTKSEFWKDILQSEKNRDKSSYGWDTSNNGWSWLWEQRFETSSYYSYYSPYCYPDSYNANEEVFTTVDGYNLFSGLPSASDFVVKDKEDVRQIRKYVEGKTTKSEIDGYNYGTYYFVGGFDEPVPIEMGTECDEIAKVFKGIPRLGIDVTEFPNIEDKDIQLGISLIFAQSPLRLRYCHGENETCAQSASSFSFLDLRPLIQRYSFNYEYLELQSYNLLSSHYNVSQVDVSTVVDESNYLDDVYYIPAIESQIMSLLSILLGASLSLTTIPIMYDLITEKHGGYVYALLLNGMKMQNYWIAHYLHHAFYFVVNSVLFFVIIVSSGVKTDLNWGSLIFVMLLYMHGQFSFICLVSNFIKKPRLATAVLMLYIFAAHFTMYIMTSISEYMESSLMADIPLALDVLPQVSFLRSVYHIATRYDQNTVLFGNSIMMVSSVVYLFLGIYLHQAAGKMAALKKSISSVTGCFKRSSTLPYHQSPSERDDKELEEDIDETIDIDVRREVVRTRELMPSETAVKVDGLSKTFQIKGYQFKNAVVDLTLAMDSGEVFGLLGPNGAGE